METLVLFEEAWAAQTFGRLYPPQSCLTWDEFLASKGEPEASDYDQERQGFADALKAAPSDSGEWLFTLDQLREVIQHPEDIELAFSHLPPSAKNDFLKSLLKVYLDSKLAENDRTARTLRFLDNVQSDDVPFALQCISSRVPSPLFRDMAKHLSTVSQHPVSYLETWQWKTSQNGERSFPTVTIQDTSAAKLLIRLARKARQLATRNRVQILFGGSVASRWMLRCQLRAHQVDFLDLDTAASAASESFSETPKVLLLPFHPLARDPEAHTLAFFEELPEPVSSLALDKRERQLLRFAGFDIGEAVPHRERNARRLNALLEKQPGHRWLFIRQEAQIGRRPVRLAPIPTAHLVSPVPKGVPVTLASLSATGIETYRECPARFYFSHVQGLRPPIDPKSSFSLWYGKLLHATLEIAFREHPWEQIDADLLRSIFDKTLETSQLPQVPWLPKSLRRRFSEAAEEIPKLELELRKTFGPLTPTRFEQDFDIACGTTRLRGRMDRVDATESGWVVFDYKTGNVDFSPEQIRKGKHFQALVYALALPADKASGVLFYDLKKSEIRRGLLRASRFPPTVKAALVRNHAVSDEKWEEILSQGRENIDAAAASIQKGEFAPSPSTEACAYCDFGVFCRSKQGWLT